MGRGQERGGGGLCSRELSGPGKPVHLEGGEGRDIQKTRGIGGTNKLKICLLHKDMPCAVCVYVGVCVCVRVYVMCM